MAFILSANYIAGRHVGGHAGFYSGRAGEGWVDLRVYAFPYQSQEAADHKAELFNGRSGLHGLKFQVVNIGEA